MNIKASYNYQLFDLKKSILVYYFVIVCVYLFMTTSMAISISMSEGTNVSGQFAFGGMEFATVIFIFITGLCSFKEVFGMLLQNGISRKSMFVGRVLTSLSIAFGMSVLDMILLLVFKAVPPIVGDNLIVSSLYEQLYLESAQGLGDFKLYITNFFFCFFLYLSFTALGYLITTLYYRMNKAGKIAVSVSVPVGFFIVLPMTDSYVTGGRISDAMARFADFAFGLSSKQPVNGMITSILAFALFSALSWLLIRRAAVKEQHE